MWTVFSGATNRQTCTDGNTLNRLLRSALWTLATLPIQLGILGKLTARLRLPAPETNSSIQLAADLEGVYGDLAFFLLFLMLVGASAFLLVRLKRKMRNMPRRPLKDVVLERTLELNRYRQMLSKAERVANVGSWEHEPGQDHFVWSDQLYRIFGFEPVEIVPDKDVRLGLVHPADQEEFVKHERMSIEEGKSYELKLRIRRPDGAQRLILHRVEPEKDNTGKVVRRIGVVSDITERAATEETFRLMFEQTPYPFMIIDEHGIIDCNPATEKMYARTKEEMIGHHPGEYSPEFQPDGRRSEEKAYEMVEKAYKNGFHRFEWTHLLPDGTEFPAEINLSTISIGNVVRLMVVMHDLRARIEEEQRQRRIEELETINRLGATLSHEFNTPLAVIRVATEMLAMQTTENPDARQHVNKIFTHIKRIRELVDKTHQLRELKAIDYAAGMKILDLHEELGGSEKTDRPSESKSDKDGE